MKAKMLQSSSLKLFTCFFLIFMLTLALLSGCSAPTQTEPAPAPAPTAEPAEEPVKTIDYPTKNIYHYVPFGAGSGIDVNTRLLADEAQKHIGASIIVENKEGAGGRVCAAEMYRAKGDGYTIFTHVLPTMVIGEVAYDGQYKSDEFTPIINFFEERYVIAVDIDSPIDSFDELIEEMGKRDLKTMIAGVGTSGHLDGLIMKDVLGVEYTEIPYDSYPEGQSALMGGHLDFLKATGIHAATNRDTLKMLAWLGPERDPRFPDLPTLKELGYDFYANGFSVAIFAPPDMPDDIREAVTAAYSTALENPELLERLTNAGAVVTPRPAEEVSAFIESSKKSVQEYLHHYQ